MTQEEALDILKLGYNVYLTGPPGSGKTFLLKKYIDYLKKNHKSVAMTASTGIAATHMGGITIHSWSGLGIKEEFTEKDFKKLLRKQYLRKRIKNTNILLIDEISMLHDFQFDLLNDICRLFKQNSKPFGGIQIVCSGDLFQLPPVQKRGQARFITESESWKNMNIKVCYLEEQHRQKKGELLALLNHIRNNETNEARKLLLKKEGKEEETSFINPIKLYTHNVDVDFLNSIELAKIKRKSFVYHMFSRGNGKMIFTLKKGCLAPETLTLKKGAKVMFVKNNFDKGYVNGTIGKVINFGADDAPIIETINGTHILVERASWTIEEEDIVKAEIVQFPLRLAWAITVHKSQGMNLDMAEIDLSKSFIEGMGYVALSRLRSLSGLKLKGINDMALMVNQGILQLDKEMKNISDRTSQDLREMGAKEKKKKQKLFLSSLLKDKKAKKKQNKKKRN